MIMPIGEITFSERLRRGAENLPYSKKSIKGKKDLNVGVGDEGGFSPNLDSERTSFRYHNRSNKKGWI